MSFVPAHPDLTQKVSKLHGVQFPLIHKWHQYIKALDFASTICQRQVAKPLFSARELASMAVVFSKSLQQVEANCLSRSPAVEP
jgi:hypothetical protein